MPSSLANILLDRDGTVIEDRHYLQDPQQVVLLPGAARGLQMLQDSGMRLYLVTNQSGIGRGYFSLRQYEAVQERVRELLQQEGVEIRDTVLCPHAPAEACGCRKPAPGMWHQLCAEHGLAPEESGMIGDKRADIVFARRAGLAFAALVRTGYGLREEKALNLPSSPGDAVSVIQEYKEEWPDLVAQDLHAACRWIVNHVV